MANFGWWEYVDPLVDKWDWEPCRSHRQGRGTTWWKAITSPALPLGTLCFAFHWRHNTHTWNTHKHTHYFRQCQLHFNDMYRFFPFLIRFLFFQSSHPVDLFPSHYTLSHVCLLIVSSLSTKCYFFDEIHNGTLKKRHVGGIWRCKGRMAQAKKLLQMIGQSWWPRRREVWWGWMNRSRS